MGYKHRMRYLLALLLMPVTALAQLEPGPEHYEAAANQIAMQRAASDLLELEALTLQVDEVRRMIADWELDQYVSEQDMLNAHAANVQRWHGLPVASIIPGTGWHEVTK
jgi:hypothetical protein